MEIFSVYEKVSAIYETAKIFVNAFCESQSPFAVAVCVFWLGPCATTASGVGRAAIER